MVRLRRTLGTLVMAVTLGLASAAGAQALSKQGQVTRLSSAVSWERLRLPGDVDLEVDAMGARLALTPHKGSPAALATAFRSHPSTLCPHASVDEGRLVLRCRTRRIEAKIAVEGRERYLDVHEVRGLPLDDSFGADPRLFWDPVGLNLGSGCPGDTAFARAECAHAAGNFDEAAPWYEAALSEPRAAGAAAIRLGDLQARRGDRAGAADRYRSAGHLGVWGRLATARICELLGHCLGTRDEERIFNPVGMPEPLRSELRLRHARALAFQSEHAAACRLLAAQAQACRLGANLCSRIGLEAMRSALPEDQAEGLSLFVTLEDRTTGPLAFELSTAAAEVAAAAGAPLFAANTLAVTVDFAPKGKLEAHLLRAAQLYLDARDPVRAAVIADFAARRLTRRSLESKSWTAVRAAVSAGTPGAEVPTAATLEAAREALREAAATPGT